MIPVNRDIENLHMVLFTFVNDHEIKLLMQKYSMKVFETYRSPERQLEIIGERPNSTSTKYSKHSRQPAEAVDIVHKDDKGWSWADPKEKGRTVEELAHVQTCYNNFCRETLKIIQLNKWPIRWGGTFKFVDMPHWEVK